MFLDEYIPAPQFASIVEDLVVSCYRSRDKKKITAAEKTRRKAERIKTMRERANEIRRQCRASRTARRQPLSIARRYQPQPQAQVQVQAQDQDEELREGKLK